MVRGSASVFLGQGALFCFLCERAHNSRGVFLLRGFLPAPANGPLLRHSFLLLWKGNTWILSRRLLLREASLRAALSVPVCYFCGPISSSPLRSHRRGRVCHPGLLWRPSGVVRSTVPAFRWEGRRHFRG